MRHHCLIVAKKFSTFTINSKKNDINLKKLLLLGLHLFFILSCTTDNFDEKSENTLNAKVENNPASVAIEEALCMFFQATTDDFLQSYNSSCSLVNLEPYTMPTTIYCYNSLQTPCFATLLGSSIVDEMYAYYGINPISISRPLRTVAYSGGDSVYLHTLIDTSDIYPNLSAYQANEIYKHFACKYQNEIESYTQSHPPGNLSLYMIEFSNIAVDWYICAGSENAILNSSYKIVKYTWM